MTFTESAYSKSYKKVNEFLNSLGCELAVTFQPVELTIAEYCRLLFQRSGISFDDFVLQSGISRNSIWKIQTNQPVKLSTLKHYVEAMGKTLTINRLSIKRETA